MKGFSSRKPKKKKKSNKNKKVSSSHLLQLSKTGSKVTENEVESEVSERETKSEVSKNEVESEVSERETKSEDSENEAEAEVIGAVPDSLQYVEPKIEEHIPVGEQEGRKISMLRLGTEAVAMVKKTGRASHDFEMYKRQIECSSLHVTSVLGVRSTESLTLVCLESGICNLGQLMDFNSNKVWVTQDLVESKPAIKKILEEWKWGQSGIVSPVKLGLIKDMVEGLKDIHDRSVIHRQITLHTIVIVIRKGKLCAKLSCLEASKSLNESSPEEGYFKLTNVPVSYKAPEICSNPPGPESYRSDIYSLGIVIFKLITAKDMHPFHGCSSFTPDLNSVSDLVARHLLEGMLRYNIKERLYTEQILRHPIFWNASKRIGFFTDVVACDLHKVFSQKLSSAEKIDIMGNSWYVSLGSCFQTHLSVRRNLQCESYGYNELSELIRLIRNTFYHYNNLLPDMKSHLGSKTDGMLQYFESRFPKLLIRVYDFVWLKHSKTEGLEEYFSQVV